MPVEVEFFSKEHLDVLKGWEKELKSDHIYPTGAHANHMLNCGGQLLQRPPANGQIVEGYWRTSMVPSGYESLPWPVPRPIEGFKRSAFIKALQTLQSRAQVTAYRGFSMNRLNGEYNGSEEFSIKGWRWPSGYQRYLQLGVLPSRQFAEFVLAETRNVPLPDDVVLPSYK